MITKLNVASIMVLNKDEALDFYVNKLGLEKGQDVKQGSYRWLTVRVPGDVTEISLEEPGPPVHDEATAAQLRELITKGALGATPSATPSGSSSRGRSPRRQGPDGPAAFGLSHAFG